MNPCTICGYVLHGSRALWTTCQACHDRITQLLADIEQMWPLLADALEPTRGHSGPRVSGTAAHALPIASRILDLIGPMGVPTRLYLRYADIALARRVQPATQPPGAEARLRLALWGIRKHLSWAVQGTDLAELMREAASIADDLRPVTAGADDTPTVPCPAQLEDGGTCTGRLRYDREKHTAACRTCHTVLDPAEWLGYWVKLNAAA
ncbi:hypothetical protein F3K34_44325 [Streptomyces sp. LBUM 1486]|uniref:hypothetical protein n=1 Tax=Streptomyces scabiei TaxID=1930 RepID=UPI001B319FE2|nr:hypothetical protein [Streptomyces sp. LBUM 1486]MBP5918807.1 hypothetical protein [Streptomyces sp. LBUM 1486]